MTLGMEHFCTAADIWQSHKQLIAGSYNGSCRAIQLIGKLGSTAADPSQELFNLRCLGVFYPNMYIFYKT